MASKRTVFVCGQCGNEYTKWMGKCTACGEWNSLVEEARITGKKSNKGFRSAATQGRKPVSIMDISQKDYKRASTGIGELDRVLGGGMVEGSVVLIGGDPGIGKSTLLLQVADNISKSGSRVLYLTGEESERQVAMRAARLGVGSQNLFINAETDVQSARENIDSCNPDYIIVDSIQTMYDRDVASAPGSVSQVRQSTAAFMDIAKSKGKTVFLIGHVTKSGSLAGPRVLEHMVDTVLYFEGDGNHNYRIIRAVKNRFGSTNELGMFEMRDTGMVEVTNPSEILLSGRDREAPGSVVAASVEGTRPLLVEVQALISPTAFGNPRRQAAGIDYNRMVLLLAVLEKRAGQKLYDKDAYVNVVGGIKLIEPAADMAVILSVASSLTGRTLKKSTAVFGEVGLTGEVRPVRFAEQRLQEAKRSGIKNVVMPQRNFNNLNIPEGLKVVGVSTVAEALMQLSDKKV